jgi:hypothetical protein
MKNYLFLIFSLVGPFLYGHDLRHEQTVLRQWQLDKQHKRIEASFLMFKDGEVYLEDRQHTVGHYPLESFSIADQALVLGKWGQIQQINTPSMTENPSASWRGGFQVLPILLWGGLLFTLFLFTLLTPRRHRWSYAMVFGLGWLVTLYGFTIAMEKPWGTDPAFIDAAFTPFKPAVHTFWDSQYFRVESKGIPDHEMMAGITAWQQQVPIPQCYVGNNAWSIPLNPVIAATPVPVNPQHFIRGAIAVAANGVPIFNPYTNTGVDAYLDGQLDNYGGHSGRADDYHYHIAPMHLDPVTEEVLPIAFALDGFAVYAMHEPDGSPMTALDANHGHFGDNGLYHYHGSPTAPYMIGNMVGEVTEDNTMQIIPQAKATPVRPSLTPLNGAVITHCDPNGSGNGYILTYTRGGNQFKVDYNWTPDGKYTYRFISPADTITENYNGFVPCDIPTATHQAAEDVDLVMLYPNPTTGQLFLRLGDRARNDIRYISIYNLKGEEVFRITGKPEVLEFGDLAGGMYLIQIQFSNSQWSRKVFVQK